VREAPGGRVPLPVYGRHRVDVYLSQCTGGTGWTCTSPSVREAPGGRVPLPVYGRHRVDVYLSQGNSSAFNVPAFWAQGGARSSERPLRGNTYTARPSVDLLTAPSLQLLCEAPQRFQHSQAMRVETMNTA
ncbi:hypothetical protein KUCAC02_008829, partial [Chaenocephalus aceratus]